MTDMLERAAKAIADKWLEKVDDATVRVGPPVIARAALLAALDPEDDALATAIARAVFNSSERAKYFRYEDDCRDPGIHLEMLTSARVCIAALRQRAHGETNDR